MRPTGFGGFGENVHLGELGGSTAGDLLDAEADELVLQLIKLLGEILLRLLPQLDCFDTGLCDEFHQPLKFHAKHTP